MVHGVTVGHGAHWQASTALLATARPARVAQVLRAVGGLQRVVTVATWADARAALGDARGISCVVVDAAMDDAGAVIATVRGMPSRARPSLALLPMHPMPGARIVAPDACVLDGRDPTGGMLAFVATAITRHRGYVDPIAQGIGALVRSRGLTPREVELLLHALERTARADIERRAGITRNTLKSMVRRLLRKLDATSLSHARCVLIEAAIRVAPHAESAWEAANDDASCTPVRRSV